ncbi:VOC family protein [Microlunatus parietis]|uniref:SAM-dependent methyltransferase n=1 Tax=Microlunatus parietis TaxID=682979 RepID=A0A7Y9I377_9ACTN|nr:VOC family protein [Microlunatus parietis]NYE69201.1 SAM-dependent methyltransferase [Microlunatus parietis]
MHRSRVGVVLIDHPRPRSEATQRFWEAAVGVPAADPSKTYGSLGWLDGVEFAFQHLEEGAPRVHLDVESDDVAAEVARLVGLGASVRVDHGEYAELADPDGLVFCVVPVQTGPARFRAGAVGRSGPGEDGVDWWAWQRSWDRQQEAFLPDREERLAALFDAVEATAGTEPRVLDLAGGTGSITIRLLERFAGASAVLVDADPALLRIAEHTIGRNDRVRIARADLRDPGWVEALPDSAGPFDAVLTATALHWFTRARIVGLYGELAGLLRPGGLFGNADHMPDPGLPALSARLADLAERRREQAYRDGVAETWPGWWQRARESAELGDAVAERDLIFGDPDPDRWKPTHDRQLEALRDAGFGEVGLVWRGGSDAAFVAVRPD